MAFCLPRLRAMRRYRAPRRVSVLAQPSRTGRARRAGTGCPCRCGRAGGSPDWLVRGVSRAQAAACPGVGNWDRSVPSSAMMTWALTAPIPVTSSSRSARPRSGCPVAGAAGGVAAAGQPAGGAGRRGAGDLRQLLLDRLVQPGDLVVDRVDQPQVGLDLEGVDVAEPAGERVLQLPGGWPSAAGRRARPAPPGCAPRRPGRRGTGGRWPRTGRRSPPRSSAGRPRGSSPPGPGAGPGPGPAGPGCGSAPEGPGPAPAARTSGAACPARSACRAKRSPACRFCPARAGA